MQVHFLLSHCADPYFVLCTVTCALHHLLSYFNHSQPSGAHCSFTLYFQVHSRPIGVTSSFTKHGSLSEKLLKKELKSGRLLVLGSLPCRFSPCGIRVPLSHEVPEAGSSHEFNTNQPFLGGKTFSRPTLLTEPAKRQNLWTPGSGSRCPQRFLFFMTAGNLIVRSEHGRGAQSFDQQKAATRRHPQPQLLPNDPGEDEMVPPPIPSRVTTLRWNEPCFLVSQTTLP